MAGERKLADSFLHNAIIVFMKQLILFPLFAFLFPITLLANDLQLQSGPVGAIVTLKPEKIVAEEPASLWLKFSDSRGLLTLKRCYCRIKIIDDKGEVVIDYKIEQDDRYIEERAKEIPLTFPKIGNYRITVSGISTNKVFEPFEIKGEISVTKRHIYESEKRWQNLKRTIVSYVIPVIVFLMVFAFGFKFAIKKR